MIWRVFRPNVSYSWTIMHEADIYLVSEWIPNKFHPLVWICPCLSLHSVYKHNILSPFVDKIYVLLSCWSHNIMECWSPKQNDVKYFTHRIKGLLLNPFYDDIYFKFMIFHGCLYLYSWTKAAPIASRHKLGQNQSPQPTLGRGPRFGDWSQPDKVWSLTAWLST